MVAYLAGPLVALVLAERERRTVLEGQLHSSRIADLLAAEKALKGKQVVVINPKSQTPPVENAK